MSLEDADWEDIGHDISIAYYVGGENDDRAGIFLWHKNCSVHEKYGGMCVGSVSFGEHSDGRDGWQVVSKDPLTLEPSILRKPCGLHGYIRNGRWEPC